MCGIFGALHASEDIRTSLSTIQHRGPDDTQLVWYGPIALGFHRLAINDLTPNGNQPLHHPQNDKLAIICNGEIYNHRELKEKYGFQTRSGSDCEIILHMYHQFGIERTLSELDGYFAFLLVDGDVLYAARDEIGVRPLFMGKKGTSLYFASEMKALHSLSEHITTFPPGQWWKSSDPDTFSSFSTLWHQPINYHTYQHAVHQVRTLLDQAVQKRVETTERPIGCLLSGGLDSSIICALVNQHSRRRTNQPIHTFSIGLEGSTDITFARIVANHLDTIHHELIVTEQDMIDAIPKVVHAIESYDTTTVRASTPMYLLCEYISKQTDIRVIFSGEGSDELSGSYLYFHKAPSAEAFYEETVRLTKDLHYFDVLRCDRSIAAHGLEVRVPFLDKEFMKYYLHLDPCLKQPASFGIEKYLLRDAFREMLPKNIILRTKAAFSDAVSDPERSWYEIIQEHVQKLVASGELDTTVTYSHNPPSMDETKWYRKLFEKSYPGRAQLIPYLWLPRWSGNQQDPSARTLDIYQSIGSAQ